MLHTVNKSPFERNNLDACLNRAAAGSAILLYEDAVYAAVAGTAVAERVRHAAEQHDVYVLAPDLQARGMKDAALVEGVKPVDYTGFVELVAARGTATAWL
ncbi:sulfurtransferase complex subunit TusB [Azospirillum halopraeferens]|uniref:sulfurtransferase complex subunit TusB n=1 Tax=Azospirillum halopraeferens TaxID=34010 RepID=UPI0004196360|nr:sulfurtransferase complex subunit TusB [Azospirillum halopraeferens]